MFKDVTVYFKLEEFVTFSCHLVDDINTRLVLVKNLFFKNIK